MITTGRSILTLFTQPELPVPHAQTVTKTELVLRGLPFKISIHEPRVVLAVVLLFLQFLHQSFFLFLLVQLLGLHR